MTTAHPRPKIQRSRLARLIVALLVTIPLVLAAVYMWVLWDPTKKVDQMPVAIVNSDTGFVKDGEPIEAGKSVADNLLESQALGFRLVDRQTAVRGLNTGDFYFTIEIPADFSETLGTIATVADAPALITVTFNDFNTIKASQIGGAAMEKIHQSVLRGVATTTVGGLVDGVQTLGDGLRKAADGSVKLSDGAGTLADGITNDLQPGVRTAREGGAKLATGAGTLADGLVTLRAGTDRLGDGATQVADGIERLTGRIPLAEVERLLAQAQTVLPNSSQLSTVTELIEGLKALEAGSRQIATELTDPTAQYRSGLNRLVDGGGELSTGASALAAGLVKIDDGVAKVADGAARLDDGAGELREGLVAGATKAPDFGDDASRISLARLISTPIDKQTVHVAQAQFQGPGGAVTILIIATMLIPIVVFMSFRGHRFVTDDETPRSLRNTLRRGLLISGISLVGVLVVGVGAWQWLSPAPDPVHLWQVVLMSAAATLMNVAAISVLFTLFGYVVGSLSSLAWLMLQLFSYGGIWMIETVPAPFQWLHWVSPMTVMRHGYIAAFNGVPGFAAALVSVLILATVGGLAVAAAVRYQRKRFPEQLADHPNAPEPATV
ncbi:YhgE/Pip family protein [Gordonia hydrophobica]|uniref:YhgE/Pip family protein n=1 Tax=Gordonia hydrophobica TaxID=40516 RepID=A0ABZ2U7J0_9ACTN|nr:YhgE/Pip family protein [Gordonia hydrophobica]MBM7365423.1 putative membrane protein [Gordonia hydrophobica]